MPKPKADGSTPVDELTKAEFDQLYADTVNQIAALRSRWRGLVALTEKSRAKHPGKNLGPLLPSLRPLFTAMLPNGHDDAKTAEARAKFAALFHVHGDTDAGKDPEHFEADLLLQRIHRVAAQQDVADKLEAFSRLLDDDALHTSEGVLIAGQHALETARSIGDGHAKYGSFLTTVFDALRNMTKAAVARAAELRAERAAAKAKDAAADAAKTATPPKTP